MLGVSESPYDLRFRFLDIPVRVQPFFWLISACLGWQNHNLPMVAVWVACVFVSVLVHEYGHALMAKKFHAAPSILLWGMGGLCIYSNSARQTPAERLAVILCGPGAGFVLCLVVMAAATMLFGITPGEHLGLSQYMIGASANLDDRTLSGILKFHSPTYYDIYRNLVWINLMWGLVNLLPILPLDGGRVSELAFSRFDPFQGTRRAHILSLVAAGCLAVIAYGFNSADLYTPIFFGSLAFINLQALQSIHQTQAMGFRQDDDWWRH